MFYRRADARDGRQYVCKPCTAQVLADWGKENPEKILASQVAFRLRDKAGGFKRKKVWREKNRKRVNEIAREGYARHRDKCLERSRDWHAKNPEKVKAGKARYFKENRTTVLAWLMRRRTKKLNAPGHSTAEQIRARIEYYGSKCYLCRVAPYQHLDHVIPLSRGGSNWPANIRPACSPCNLKKSDRLLSEVL